MFKGESQEETVAEGGKVEHPLGNDEADGEEQVGGRDEGEDQEAKAEEDNED